MSNLKDQQKKLLRAEITGKVMEHLMGLNEENECAICRLAEKSAKKMVKAYYKAIKSQHKKALKATAKQEKNAEVLPIAEPVVLTEQPDLIAS
jgi:hypothetical protein